VVGVDPVFAIADIKPIDNYLGCRGGIGEGWNGCEC
jgi:hypothetical protein